jgi:hypothetical protein
VLLLSALLLPTEPLLAQTRMSVVAGPAMSNVSGADTEGAGYTGRTGVYIGIATELPLLGSFLSVLPGGSYLDRGYNFDGDTYKLKLPYVEISAPLRVSVPLGSTFGMHLFGGPGFALAFGCSFIEQQDNVQSSFTCEPSDFLIRSWDVTAILGGGLSIAVAGPTRLLLQAAVDNSLMTIDSGNPRADIKHRTLLITAGASFALQNRR